MAEKGARLTGWLCPLCLVHIGQSQSGMRIDEPLKVIRPPRAQKLTPRQDDPSAKGHPWAMDHGPLHADVVLGAMAEKGAGLP